ncbi:hypothetical protein ACWDSF_32400 [Nocardia beijingensis]
MSISYALGSIVGGVFARMDAQWIQQTTGSSAVHIAYYLLEMTALGSVGTLLLRDRMGIDLRPAKEAEQQVGICEDGRVAGCVRAGSPLTLGFSI